jgi:hypothetical protein
MSASDNGVGVATTTIGVGLGWGGGVASGSWLQPTARNSKSSNKYTFVKRGELFIFFDGL